MTELPPELDPADEADAVFRTAVTLELGLGVLALFLGWLTAVNVHQWLPKLAWENLPAIGGSLLGGTLAAIPLLIVVQLLERVDWAPLRRLKQSNDSPMVAALLSLRRRELIAVSIAAGVGEELLVRGWLMAWLIGPWAAATLPAVLLGLLASSLAFGMMHPITPTYVLLTTLVGVYFGALVLWRGDLLIAIVAHSVYDAVHLLLVQRSRNKAATA